MRTIDELQDQINRHENRLFEISQQVRALAWETKQRTGYVKNLKSEIRLTKRQLRREKWQKKFNTQQDIKELTNARFWPTDKAEKRGANQ